MDVRRIIEDKFGSVQVCQGSNGTEYLVVCPHCGKRKLSINPQKGVYQCWHGCDSGSLRKLLKLPGNFRTAPPPKPAPKVHEFIPAGELLPLHTLSNDHQAIAYIKSRGFDPKYLEETFGVCYCQQGKKFAGQTYDTSNTIILPIWQNEVLIGWQSRLLYNPDTVTEDFWPLLGWKYEDGKYVKPPKYMTMPGYQKRSSLYNFDWARQSEVVVVTEGAFDCMAVGRCAVATFGKGVSEEQVAIIKNTWKAAILLLDPDAESEQERLLQSLRRSVLAVPIHLSGYKDAGECPQKEIWRQIRETVRTYGDIAKALETMKYTI